jgi:hypothetical protein
MSDHIEGDNPDVDDADSVERDGEEEEIERAPQPGNTPAPAESPPFDSTVPRERPDPDQ